MYMYKHAVSKEVGNGARLVKMEAIANNLKKG